MRTPTAQVLAGVDLDELASRGREALAEGPLTFAELGQRLLASGPIAKPTRSRRRRAPSCTSCRCRRADWGRSGAARHATAESWLGALPVEPFGSISRIVRRYLAAFGPASVRDMQSWSGLTGLKSTFARTSRAATFRDAAGGELFDLPDAPRPDPEMPAPVRYLPEWDNLFLSHADRARGHL